MIAEVESKLALDIADIQGRLAELHRRINQDKQRVRELEERLCHLLTVQKCGS